MQCNNGLRMLLPWHSKYLITSSIYRTRSYMKWRYGGVRHGAIGGNSRDIAFGVLALG